MDTLQSYDQLPYDRSPFPEAEPDFLAALVRLHGFDAADARKARVLELGCAMGGNLIPMAARYQQSEFVGIDLSRVQVEEGQAFITRTGLENIQLLHGDIAALPDNLGEFDFIIAHGVYSWVPDFVREALLKSCHRLLKPQGIAYISYNVEAGWRLYGQIRQLLLQHDQSDLSPMRRVEKSRAVLTETSYEDERLRKEVDYLLRATDAYVFHECLSEVNSAYSFAQFVSDAAESGLHYLGEAGPRRARVALENDRALSPERRYERWLEAEENLDNALNTRFRRSLLVRDDAGLPQPQQPALLKSLAFSAELFSEDELDFAEATEQYFEKPTGERFPVRHPLLKAFLMVVASAYPEVASYDRATTHALNLAQEYGYQGDADEKFLEALLDIVQMHGVGLHTFSPLQGRTQDAFPKASALTRAQASSRDWPVTSPFHNLLDVDEWGRKLLTAMDGSRSVEELGQNLLNELARAGIEAAPGQVAQHVQEYFAFFRRQGLMI